MSPAQVVSSYINDNQQTVRTDTSYTLDKSHQVVIVGIGGIVLTMPPNPETGEEHIVVAEAASLGVAVLGGAFPSLIDCPWFSVARFTTCELGFNEDLARNRNRNQAEKTV